MITSQSNIKILRMMIETELNYELDLKFIAEHFPLDVEYENNTELIVSQGSLVQQTYNITDNKKVVAKQIAPFKGFVKLQYPESKTKMTYHSPPKMIPVGCYCFSCNNVGPVGHSTSCINPSFKHLKLTLNGLKNLIASGNKVSSLFLNDFIQDVTFDNDLSKYELISQNGEILTNVNLSDADKIVQKSHNKDFYPGTVLLSYVFDNLGSCSIRIQKKKIEIVTCPWNNFTALEETIKRISQITGEPLQLTNIFIGSAFGISNISANPDKYMIDINKIHNNLTLTDQHTYNGVQYLTTLKTTKIKGRIKISVTNDTTIDKYIISVILFKTGNVQLYFTVKDKYKLAVRKIFKNLTYSEQKNFINNVVKTKFKEVINFIAFLLNQYLNNGDQICVLQEPIKISEKINSTIPGVSVYHDKAIINVGSLVQVFDPNIDEWWDDNFWSTPGIVQKRNGDNFTIVWGNTSLVPLDFYTKINETCYVNIEKSMVVPLKRIRIYKDSLTSKLYTGIAFNKKLPEPLSFFGNCGPTEIVDLEGVRSRTDGKIIPVCKEYSKNPDVVTNYYVDLVMNGVPESVKNKANIERTTYKDAVVDDKYSGIFKPDKICVGATVTFWDGEKWSEGTIEDIEKIQGIKNKDGITDPKLQHVLYVITKIFDEDEEYDDDGDEEREIVYKVRGEMLHPKYRDSRNFEGLNTIFNNDKHKIKQYLLNCAQKLGIIRESVVNEIPIEILNSFNRKNTELYPLSNSYLKDLSDNLYRIVYLPQLFTRCFIIISKNKAYVLTDKGSNYSIDINYSEKEVMFDAYLHEDKYYIFDELMDKYEDLEIKIIKITSILNKINNNIFNIAKFETKNIEIIYTINNKYVFDKVSFLLIPEYNRTKKFYYSWNPRTNYKIIVNNGEASYSFKRDNYVIDTVDVSTYPNNLIFDYYPLTQKIEETFQFTNSKILNTIVFNMSFIIQELLSDPVDKNMFTLKFWYNDNENFALFDSKSNKKKSFEMFTEETLKIKENIL